MRIQRTLFVLAVPLLIIAFDHVAKGQESKPATNWEVKKLVYHVQSSGHSDVYVQDDPKMEVRQLVPGGQDPAWSSDGEKIAFLGSRYSHVGQHAMLAENEIGPSEWTVGGLSLAARQIQVINPDGSGTKQITNLSNGVWDFAWSPVENKIAYCELGKDGKTAIVVINADGSGRQELSKMGEIRCAVGMPVLQRTLDKNKFMVPGRVAGGKALIKLVGPQENTPASETASGELIGVPTLAELDRGAGDDSFPVKPQRLVADIRRAMGRDDIVLVDTGAVKMWMARLYPAYAANTCLISNGLATMGFALPGAIAAKLACPERKVLAVMGDGSFLMNSQELETAVREKIHFVALVWEDRAYGLIKWKMELELGRDSHCDFTNPDFVEYAQSLGVKGYRVRAAGELLPTLNRALADDAVSLVACPVDYSENLALTKKLGELTDPL